MKVALLTGGSDRPYALGLLEALLEGGFTVDVVGSDEFVGAPLLSAEGVRFFNLRGDTGDKATRFRKVVRIARYYLALTRFAVKSDAQVFHILWANRFWFIDRVALNVIYKALGRRLAFTAHNVNERKRDGKDGWYNRITLRSLYRLMDHIFVHTVQMRGQLMREFAVSEAKISVIPFGINNTFPRTEVTGTEARERLGIKRGERVLLFFGRVASYKGLEYAVDALARLRKEGVACRLLIAGRIERGCEVYWEEIRQKIVAGDLEEQITSRIEYIADDDVELYFKASDVLVLPYKAIFQSGLLFLTYSYGLPVIAADIGSFREDIVEGVTGFLCAPGDSAALAAALATYFDSELYKNLERERSKIIAWGNSKYAWEKVAEITGRAYLRLSPQREGQRVRIDTP